MVYNFIFNSIAPPPSQSHTYTHHFFNLSFSFISIFLSILQFSPTIFGILPSETVKLQVSWVPFNWLLPLLRAPGEIDTSEVRPAPGRRLRV